MGRRLTDAERITRCLREQLVGFEKHLDQALRPSGRSGHARSDPSTVRARGAHSDPTADAALDDGPIDPQARAAAEAFDLLVKAGNAVARVRHLTTPRTTPAARPRCVNCSRYGVDEEAEPGREGRCQPCYRYRRRHDGEDAPALVVLRRHGRA